MSARVLIKTETQTWVSVIMSICCPFIEALEQPAGCRAYRAHTSPSTHTPVFTLLHEMLHRTLSTREHKHDLLFTQTDERMQIWACARVTSSRLLLFPRHWRSFSKSPIAGYRRPVPPFRQLRVLDAGLEIMKGQLRGMGGIRHAGWGEAVNLRVPVFFIYIPYKFMLMTQNWLLLDELSQRHQAGNLGALQSLSPGWMDGACVTAEAAEAFFSVLFIPE